VEQNCSFKRHYEITDLRSSVTIVRISHSTTKFGKVAEITSMMRRTFNKDIIVTSYKQTQPSDERS